METSPQSRFVKISNQERKGSKYWGLEGRDIMGKITFSMDVNIETGTYTYVDEKTQKLYSNDPALSKLPICQNSPTTPENCLKPTLNACKK